MSAMVASGSLWELKAPFKRTIAPLKLNGAPSQDFSRYISLKQTENAQNVMLILKNVFI